MKTKLISAVVISVCVLLFSTQAIAESFTNELPHVITVTESFSDTVNRILPSVCMVISKVVVSLTEIDSPEKKNNIPPLDLNNDDKLPWNNPRPPPAAKNPIAVMGTCFIVSYKNKKFVITNHHVVDSTKNITTEIRFYGNLKTYSAIIVGKDMISDIAVLKMSTLEGQTRIRNIKELQWGNSNNMRQGDDAWAVGHPMQQEWSVTKGIISYVGRRTNSIRQELIQSDVAINTGNSGGPLLNIKGEVIGVNTFIISSKRSGGQVGVNFSVTSNLTKRVMEQLIDTGIIKRAKIGIIFEIDYDRGLFVIKELEAKSPAEKAGIKPEDLIIKINGRDIYLIDDIGKAFDYVLPGDEVEVVILRGDEIFEIIIKTTKVVVINDGH